MKNLRHVNTARHTDLKHDSRCSLVAVIASTAAQDLPDQFWLNPTTAYALHHCEVLEIVVRLEKSVAGEELDQDASDAPDVAWIAPSEVQYNLGCSVVSCRNDGGVILVVEGCRSEVNESDLGVKKDSPLACNALHGSRR